MLKAGPKIAKPKREITKKNLCSSRDFCLVNDLLHPHDFNHMISLSKIYPLVPTKSSFCFLIDPKLFFNGPKAGAFTPRLC